MSEVRPCRGLIVAHGTFARGLIDAVRAITGADEDALVALSNTGRSPEQLAADIEACVREGRWVVFTDMQVGSCAFTARRLCRSRGDLVVVTGANLPMLLDFVVNRELPAAELAQRALSRGQQGMCVVLPDGRTDAGRAVSGG